MKSYHRKMPSSLLILAAAACVVGQVNGFLIPRINESPERRHCMNRSRVEYAEFFQCMNRTLENGVNLEELYGDLPCPRCSYACSKRAELQECRRRYSDSLTDLLSGRAMEIARFGDEIFESGFSLICRPNVIEFLIDEENTLLLSQKLQRCSPIMFIGSPDYICEIQDSSLPEFEGKICRHLAKVAECVEAGVKEEKPELEDIMTTLTNGIKDMNACRGHQEINESE